MSAEFEIQKSIEKALRSRQTLTAILSSKDAKRGIYDFPPQAVDGGDPSLFPYVTLGQDSFAADNTDTTSGLSGLLTINSWSRQPSYSECKRINAEIWRELHRADLDIYGVHLTNIEHESSDYFRDPDGKTIHGIIEFRILATIL